MIKTKILIVDDHRIVIEGIKSCLAQYSEFEVVGEAVNGRQAVKLAGSLNPDVIVMDISMPDLNGIDATMQIKKNNPGIRIIIYTMNSNREFIIDLFKAGISGYVLKEDPISDLMLAIKAIKSGNSYFSTKAPSVLVDHLLELEGGKVEKNRFESLSLREREVFQLLAEGRSVKEAAERLSISPKTVETHKYSIFNKLEINSMTDLIKIAIRKKIVSL